MIDRCIVLSLVIWTSARMLMHSAWCSNEPERIGYDQKTSIAQLQNEIRGDVALLKRSARNVRMARRHRFENPDAGAFLETSP